MPRQSQLAWWLEKEPDINKATELWKLHQKSNTQKQAEKAKQKFESQTYWGDWEVLQPIKYETRVTPAGKNRLLVKVRCKCGTEDFITRGNLVSGRSKSCRGCYHRGNLNNRWNGYEDMPGTVFHRIKRGWYNRKTREQRDLQFKVTRKDLYDKFVKQNGKCAYTGLDLNWDTASLDRIDPSIGYIPDNIQWVFTKINFMKWDLSHEDFIKYCKLITENNS